MKRILVVTGMPLAGKSIFCKVLKEKGVPVITMSHIVKEEMRSKGIKITNRSLREYPTDLRKKHGMDIVARKCKELVDNVLNKNNLIVINGARGSEEIEFFRKQYNGSITIIAIIASQKVRFERFRSRSREDDAKEWEEFIFRDNEELKWGVGNMIVRADYEIINEGTLEELKNKSEQPLKEIMES